MKFLGSLLLLLVYIQWTQARLLPSSPSVLLGNYTNRMQEELEKFFKNKTLTIVTILVSLNLIHTI